MRAGQERRSDELSEALLALAGLPDDSVALPDHLSTIVRLSASVVDPVDFASVTVPAGPGHRTQARSAEAAQAVDEAQYADQAGPCLLALHSGETVGVPDVVGAVVWPGFRDVAWRYGIRASLSIPLFAGSGVPVAGLNLYGREVAGMRLLIQRVQACYGGGSTPVPARMDAGSEQLLLGLAGALRTRDLVQRALGVLMDRDNVPVGAAYRRLVEETGSGGSLPGTATAILRQYAR
ncbi:GAF domain-containing protein [Micromonospora sp. NPDC005298]|uniref:GAF domain-containing protein n=1 Tax=Micromonospora sp. NPDC005298 TaxID=3156873 RepID=UPI0033A603A7